MLIIDPSLSPTSLVRPIEKLFEISATKIRNLEESWDANKGTPVFTAAGKYTSRGWTEWTQGFQFGSAILQFDATDEKEFLELGRERTLSRMAPHLSHTGVHDHGFNNVSTFGNLHRLMREGRIAANDWEERFYALALKLSGAVQAARWTQLSPDLGYVYSFNGPHSLFSDTIRSMRVLALSHQLGHRLMGEKDQPINLLHRLLIHGEATARFNVYFGQGRDKYDVPGRVVHESIFNLNDGSYRCPSTQQGYSPFSTWTRGQAWVLSGYAELLEFLASVEPAEFPTWADKGKILARFEETASVVAQNWLRESPSDGIPYWDTGAPQLQRLGDWASRPADPFNDLEPVDSSAAAIAAQGLIRLGNYLRERGRPAAEAYYQAGLTIASTLFAEPYLSKAPAHQGLLLHSVYHRPNGWDYVPPGRKIPCGESSMWGDYHLRELALMILRQARGQRPYQFFIEP